jgi:hypothetical protein
VVELTLCHIREIVELVNSPALHVQNSLLLRVSFLAVIKPLAKLLVLAGETGGKLGLASLATLEVGERGLLREATRAEPILILVQVREEIEIEQEIIVG